MREEEDHWFLPAPPEDVAPTDLPWPMARHSATFKPREWLRGEAQNGRGLADAAAAFARLDERLRTDAGGLQTRLALYEAEDLLWAEGARVGRENLALYQCLRVGALREARALSAGDWAVRRMVGTMMPDDLAGFLGRRTVEEDGLADIATRAVGEEFEGLQQDWTAALEDLSAAHPITRAAGAFYAWRVFGLSEPGDVLEAGVVAARIGASGARALRFLPLGGRYGPGQGGPVGERLAGWYRMVENACFRALMELDRLEDWRVRALESVADMSGKTPPCLVAALVGRPVVSAAMVAEICGGSQAAARRNLAAFTACGLVREVTGQGRYRFWAARV